MKAYRRRNRLLSRQRRLSVFSTAGLLTLGMALGVAYVYLGCRCQMLGQEIQRLEAQVEQERERCMREEYAWARLTAPDRLEAALARQGIRMTWPKAEQVVHVRPQPARSPMVADRRPGPGPHAPRLWHE